MGSVPPVDSIVISDQIIPVEISTDATCKIAMLSSVLPKRWRFTRLTCSGVTTIRVGKNTLPRVQRLAANVSPVDIGVVDIAFSEGACGSHRTAMLKRATRV